jgi:hypothetical protein
MRRQIDIVFRTELHAFQNNDRYVGVEIDFPPDFAGLTVLYLDKDFDVIARVTGQPVERLNMA